MTEPKIPAAVSVDWWYSEIELEGVQQFKAELAENYAVSVIRDRRGPLGGGLYQLVIEFLSRLTLAEVARILLEGATYDLIKSGTDAFFIRPFLDAYKRFKSRQKKEREARLGIDEISFVFQDATITIQSLPNTDLLAELESIFRAFARNYESIIRGSKGQLLEIYIPVFEDTSDERVSKFRTLLNTDETLDVSRIRKAEYFKLWGLEYYSEGSLSCVYDVERKIVIEERFYTESQYWSAKMYSRKRSQSS
jgi:hypothetical protein